MSRRGIYFVSGLVVCGLVLVFASACSGREKKSRGKQPPKQTMARTDGQESTGKEYLSITYTTGDSSTKTGRMMNFYSYDLASDKLARQAQIPFTSQYALGAVSLSENKIYYAQGTGGDEMSVDHLCVYDCVKGKSMELEHTNRAYNDIIPLQGKLLVTTTPMHAIGTGIFDLNNRKFSYLYEMSENEDGYDDFTYTTAPTPLNYNYRYDRFVNISLLEKDLYDDAVRSGEKPLQYRIALVDTQLTVKNEYAYSLKSLLDYRIAAVTQIAKDSVLLLVEKDLSGENSELESENEFYRINFTEQSCKKVETPFPKMRYIDNFITLDDGESYYVSGENTEGVSGLFHYDRPSHAIKPILLDDTKQDSHIVNFCLVKQ